MASTGGALVSKAHSAPDNHNQPVADPIAYFKALPWCHALLSDPAVIKVIVVDRRPLESGESNFMRKTVNTATTVKACVTFFRLLNSPKTALVPSNASASAVSRPLSASAALLSGGGKENGEDPRNPFLLFNALLEMGVDCQGYAGTLHGGLFAVIMDEVMGTAANFQSANGAYTVRFTTNYKRPIKTPQVLLSRGRVIKKEGRKLHVRGSIEDKDGNLMAEAEGLWICMPQNVGRSQL